MKIAVLGAGAWGGALAQVLADNKHDVMIWGHQQSVVDFINIQRSIPALDKLGYHHIELPPAISASTELEIVLQEAELVVSVVPSYVLRSVMVQVNEKLKHPVIFVNATKGMEAHTHLLMSQIIEEVIDTQYCKAAVALSGPSHAEEVIQRKLTAVVAAHHDLQYAQKIQRIFNNQTYFRVYTNSDRVGVEIGGALKNIIAIISGMHTEYNLGDNAKAALITRGLYEITKIGVYFGANERTFSGLSGLGDLIVTTMSEHSRNFQAGRCLAQGMNVAAVEQQMGATIEGFHAVKSVHELTAQKEIYAPLLDLVYTVIQGDYHPEKLLNSLFEREMKGEFVEENTNLIE